MCVFIIDMVLPFGGSYLFALVMRCEVDNLGFDSSFDTCEILGVRFSAVFSVCKMQVKIIPPMDGSMGLN